MATSVGLPDGFELDTAPTSSGELPDGFELDTPAESKSSGIAHALARTGRDIVGGVAGIGDIGYAAVAPIYHAERKYIGEPIAKALGIEDYMGAPQDTSKMQPSVAAKTAYDAVTNNAGVPQNGTEAVVDKATEFLTQAAAGAPLTNVTTNVATTAAPTATSLLGKTAEALSTPISASKALATGVPKTASQAASVAGAGAGSEIAHRAFPESSLAPLIGSIIGGAGTSAATHTPSKLAEIVRSRSDSARAYKFLERTTDPKEFSEITKQLQDNPDLTLPDVGGNELQSLTRQVGKFRSGPRNLIHDFYNDRSVQTSQRLMKTINSDVSGVDKYYDSLESLATARSAIAKPLYKEAFQANQNIMSPEINSVLDTPAGQSALKSAAIKMQNDMTLMGVPNAELQEQAKLANEYQPGGIADGFKLRTLDYVKRALDDQIGPAIRAGENDNARILTGLKNNLIRELDQADITAKAGPNSFKPEGGAYKQARQVYSDKSSLIDAQEAGLQYKKSDPEQLKKYLKDLNPAEKDAFKIGVRKSLQKDIMNTPLNTNEAVKIFGRSAQRNQLEAILGNQYPQFAKKMLDEIKMNNAKNNILGGSRTDFNMIDDDKFIQAVRKQAESGRIFSVATVKTLTNLFFEKYKGLNKNISHMLAEILTDNTKGIEAVERLAKKQADPNQARLIRSFINDNFNPGLVLARSAVGDN